MARAERAHKYTPKAQAALGAVADEVAAEQAPGWQLHGPRPNARIKATPATIKAILAGIESGLTTEKAIMLAGISEDSVERWRKTNKTLSQLFRKAELKVEQELIECVRTASRKDWKAGAWLLERRFQWEQRTKTELTGKDGATLTVSQQLFATVAKGGDVMVKQRKQINVTPKPKVEQRTNNTPSIVEVQAVAVIDTNHDTTKAA